LLSLRRAERQRSEEQSVHPHGIKGFVILTKSFVKIGITKILCYNNQMFSSINITFGCCGKILVAAAKFWLQQQKIVAVTKPFFHVQLNGPCIANS